MIPSTTETTDLADAVTLVASSLPDAVLPSEALSAIQRLAALLAPVYWGGFEFRLNGGGPVDFTQGMDGPHRIARALEAPIVAEGRRRYDAWQRIVRFGRQWERPGSVLNRHVGRIGWEFDVHAEGDLFVPPAMFMELRPAEAGVHTSDHTMNGIIACLDILKPDMPAPIKADIRRCIDLCPSDGGIFQFGVMLSRPINALRIDIWGLGPESVVDIIGDLSGKTPDRSLQELVHRLSSVVSRFVLCFDLGFGPPARFGLECIPDVGSQDLPGWTDLFAVLTDLGLCREGERRALLQWPSIVEPFTASTPWPEDLIVGALQSPPDTFSMFRKDLNHIKVDWLPDRPPAAKGYVRYQHVWHQRVLPVSKADRHDP